MLFGVHAGLYLSAILLMTLMIDKLTPHYSYLIEKQKEIIAASETNGGLNQRDMRILETPEY